jgi:hypothetical protein
LTAQWACVDRHLALSVARDIPTKEEAMNGRTWSATVVALVVLAFPLVAACGGDDGDGGSDRSATASTSQFSEDLLGTYERTVTKADVARTADRVVKAPGFESTPPGPHRLVIEDGVFRTVDLSDNVTIAQYVSASDDGNFDIGNYVDPGKGAFCGQSVPQAAIYSWALEGDVLTLTAVSESCADRDSVLTGKWTRTEDQ